MIMIGSCGTVHWSMVLQRSLQFEEPVQDNFITHLVTGNIICMPPNVTLCNEAYFAHRPFTDM